MVPRFPRGKLPALTAALLSVWTVLAWAQLDARAREESAPDALFQRALHARYASDRVAAMTTLLKLPRAAEFLSERIRSPLAMERTLALQGLIRLQRADLALLELLLRDEDAWVRSVCGRALIAEGYAGARAVNRALADPGYPYHGDLELLVERAVIEGLDRHLLRGRKAGFYDHQFLEACRFGVPSVRALGRLLRAEIATQGDMREAAADALGDMTEFAEAAAELQGWLDANPLEEGARIGDGLYHAVVCALWKHGQRQPAQDLIAVCERQGAIDRLSLLYIRTRQFRAAISAYRQLIDRLADSSNVDVYIYNSACVFSLAGMKELAVEYLKRAVAYGYDDVKWMKEDGDLNPLRTDPAFQTFMTEFEAALAQGSAHERFSTYKSMPMKSVEELFGDIGAASGDPVADLEAVFERERAQERVVLDRLNENVQAQKRALDPFPAMIEDQLVSEMAKDESQRSQEAIANLERTLEQQREYLAGRVAVVEESLAREKTRIEAREAERQELLEEARARREKPLPTEDAPPPPAEARPDHAPLPPQEEQSP